MSEDMDARNDLSPPELDGSNVPSSKVLDIDYGPWMLVSRRRGHDGGRGGAPGSGRLGHVRRMRTQVIILEAVPTSRISSLALHACHMAVLDLEVGAVMSLICPSSQFLYC